MRKKNFIIFTIIICSFAFIQKMHAKDIISTPDKQYEYERYSQTKRWQIVAVRKVDEEYAASCRIYSVSSSYHFNLRYTGSLGWALSVSNLNAKHYLFNSRPISIYVDYKLIGTKQPANHTGVISSIIFGLETKYLNPIIQGHKLLLKQGKRKVIVPLRGLSGAYQKALGCWRDRMNSIAYEVARNDPKVTDQLKKDIEFSAYVRRHAHKQKSLSKNSWTLDERRLTKHEYKQELKRIKRKAQSNLAANLVIKKFGWKFAKAKQGDEKFFEYEIVERRGGQKTLYLGTVWQLSNSGHRASPQYIQSIMNQAVAETLGQCDKTAVEKQRPFFTANNIEAHSVNFLCGTSQGELIHRKIMALQDKEKILLIFLTVPSDGAEPIGQELWRETAEAVSSKVF